MPAPGPRELPELRLQFLAAWEVGHLFHAVTRRKLGQQNLHADDEWGWGTDHARYVQWERGTLAHAALWWIAEPMVELLIAASRSVPDDVLLDELPPIPRPLVAGFAVLEKPWIGHSSTPGENDVQVDAIVWGPTRLPPIREGYPNGIDAFSFSAYCALDPPDDLDGEAGRIAMGGKVWAPLGRSDWPLPDRLGDEPWPMPPETLASFVEDRRILAALWTLLHQEGIASTTLDVGPRAARRRAEREGRPVATQHVRIVTLRGAHRPGEPGDVEVQVERDFRWIVEGHWRNQPFGPGRAQRRLQWISPYLKGPEGKPVREREVVRAWRR